MSMTSAYTGWIPLSGGLDEARKRLGIGIAHIFGYPIGQAVTRSPDDIPQAPDEALLDPIPEVWLSYPTIGPSVRVVNLTERSDLYRADAADQTVAVCTMLAQAGIATDRPDGRNLRGRPGRLRQKPLLIGCFEFPALTYWAGPDLAVRLHRGKGVAVALCAPPRTLARFGLAIQR